jgi:hypothetical protein
MISFKNKNKNDLKETECRQAESNRDMRLHLDSLVRVLHEDLLVQLLTFVTGRVVNEYSPRPMSILSLGLKFKGSDIPNLPARSKIPAFSEVYDEFGMNSLCSKEGKVEISLWRVLQCFRTNKCPGIVPAVPGSLAPNELHGPRELLLYDR